MQALAEVLRPMSKLVSLAVVIVVTLSLFLSACASKGPEDSFRAFYVAVARGDAPAMWSHFSEETKAELSVAMAKLDKEGEPAKKPEERIAASGLIRVMREIVSIEVLTQARGQAVIEVLDETGAKQQVHMRLENELWRIQLDLPAP